MKNLLRILARFLFLGALLIAVAILYSSARGYITWYFRVNGQVTVNGHKTKGDLHPNTQRTQLFLTRTDEPAPETYLVSLEHNNSIQDCGKWHPIRFLANRNRRESALLDVRHRSGNTSRPSPRRNARERVQVGRVLDRVRQQG